jgi:hypothetical protein
VVGWFPHIMRRAKGIERPLLFSHSSRFVAQETQHTWQDHFLSCLRLCNRNSINKLFSLSVLMDFSCWKNKFSANIAQIVWAVYTVSWHSMGNVTQFKEITNLKQTNLEVVSLTSFYISLTSANFCSTSYHPQPPYQTGTVPVWPFNKRHYSPSGSAVLTHVSLPK